jgi:hypothetical protein
VEYVERKNMGVLGNPDIHQPLACGILDRAIVFSIAESQLAFFVNRISPDGDLYDNYYL